MAWLATIGRLSLNGPLPSGNRAQEGWRAATAAALGSGEKATSPQRTRNWASGADSRISSVRGSRARAPDSVGERPLTPAVYRDPVELVAERPGSAVDGGR